MNKVICILALLFSISMYAEAGTVRVIGVGKGHTATGNQKAACEIAYNHADKNAETKCDKRDGEIVDMDELGCKCKKQPGPGEHFSCRAKVRATCSIP